MAHSGVRTTAENLFPDLFRSRQRRIRAADRAVAAAGLVWITIWMATTCSKLKLIPNGPKPGDWFCNTCQKVFDVPYDQPEGAKA